MKVPIRMSYEMMEFTYDKRLSIPAVNLKQDIHTTQIIPLPIRHPRSALRGTRPNVAGNEGMEKNYNLMLP